MENKISLNLGFIIESDGLLICKCFVLFCFHHNDMYVNFFKGDDMFSDLMKFTVFQIFYHDHSCKEICKASLEEVDE